MTLEQNPPERKFLTYIKKFLSGGFRSKVKIAAGQVFPTPPYFCWQLAFFRHLPTSGRQNKVKTAPQPLIVCLQGICCPICEHHFTHWTHPDISFRFRAGGRRLKNFHFSRNSIAARVFFLPACCGLNFDATDLPNSSFEPFYPKLFRGRPEVDLVSTVWPPDLPKVR